MIQASSPDFFEQKMLKNLNDNFIAANFTFGSSQNYQLMQLVSVSQVKLGSD